MSYTLPVFPTLIYLAALAILPPFRPPATIRAALLLSVCPLLVLLATAIQSTPLYYLAGIPMFLAAFLLLLAIPTQLWHRAARAHRARALSRRALQQHAAPFPLSPLPATSTQTRKAHRRHAAYHRRPHRP